MTNRQPTRAYGLVRDRYGRPKFDNIYGIPASLWNMLTAEEQDEIRARGGYPEGELR